MTDDNNKPTPAPVAIPLTKEDDNNIELILDEWEKGKIHTIYNRQQLKSRMFKIKDSEYLIPIPPEAITDLEIKFVIKIRPGVLDPKNKDDFKDGN